MYYEEPYKRKRKKRQPRRRRRTFGWWLAELCLRLVALLLTVLILSACLLYALPVSLFAVEPPDSDLSLTSGLPSNRANILLLGLDERNQNTQRSDTVIIASIGYGKVKLTSVLRDTVMSIPGHGSGKLNAAYAYGGPELVLKTLNENLKLNIIHYIAVDYAGLVRVVDALDGVDLDISEAEMEKINHLINAHRSRFAARGYTAPDLAHSGAGTHLNGLQALTYARIRKLDSDFMRTSRQRALLQALLVRLRGSLWNPVRLVRLGKAILLSAQTDMSPLELISLGEKALAAGAPETLRLPVDGSYTDDGSSLRVNDMQMNIGQFQTFVYD